MTRPNWQDRLSLNQSTAVDRVLAKLRPKDFKLENLEAVRARRASLEGFHTIDFGAIQLSEDTVRAIARECGIEKLLKPSKKDPEHLAMSYITPPFGQLYTQIDDDHAGTRVDVKQLKHVSAEHLRGLASFVDEITRLREGIIAAADAAIADGATIPKPRVSRGKGRGR